MIAELGQAALLGITYGFGPCTISCAPLVVPLIMSVAKNRREGVLYSLVFSFGRVLSYVLLGVLSGLVSSVVDIGLPKRFLGIIIILLGIAVMLKLQKACILKSGMRITGKFMAFIVGFFLGLSPCPPLIALLGMTLLTRSPLTGGLMGLLFGLGTIISPILLLGFLSGWFAKQKEFKEIIPKVSGLFLIILGITYLVS